MGEIIIPELVRPIAGLLCCQKRQLAGIIDALKPLFGTVIKKSKANPFTYTSYYEPEMGRNLWRQYVVFANLLDPEELAEWKTTTNQMEKDFGHNVNQGRLVNIDPGYLAPGKLILASSKDHGHRIYLKKGIYAEITLKVEKKKFVIWPWTYPDYAAMSEFFDEAYQDYLQAIKVKS